MNKTGSCVKYSDPPYLSLVVCCCCCWWCSCCCRGGGGGAALPPPPLVLLLLLLLLLLLFLLMMMAMVMIMMIRWCHWIILLDGDISWDHAVPVGGLSVNYGICAKKNDLSCYIIWLWNECNGNICIAILQWFFIFCHSFWIIKPLIHS